MDESVARIKTTTSMEELNSADFVIEAVSENEDLKKKIFTQLDKIVKPSAILASNTSSISITRLSSVTSRPSQACNACYQNHCA